MKTVYGKLRVQTPLKTTHRCKPIHHHLENCRRLPRLRATENDLSPELQLEIEQSSTLIDEMVRDVNKHLLIDSATAYVNGQPTITEEEINKALQLSVESRIDDVNATFLPMLDSYILAAQEITSDQDKNNNILGVLLGIKRQIIETLSTQLPDNLKVLESALSLANADERLEILRGHISGDREPKCDPSTLAATSARLIDDLQGEEGHDVVDHRLLAKMCIIREELKLLLSETSFVVDDEQDDDNSNPKRQNKEKPKAKNTSLSSESPYTILRGVPQQEVAFLKELLAVSESEQRRYLLESAFKGDFIKNTRMKIRSGAFLDCITALQKEMNGPKYEAKNAIIDSEDGSIESGGLMFDEGVLLRLEDIWRESLIVLEDIAGNGNYNP